MRALTRSKDVASGLFCVLVGAVFLVGAFQIEQDPSSASVVGPRAAPTTIALAIVVGGLALALQGMRGRERPPETDTTAREPSPEDPLLDVPALDMRRVLVCFALFAAYIVAFIPVGYLLSTFAFLMALTTYVDRSRLVRNAVFAAVFAVSVYFLFQYGLRVEVPPGVLG